MGCECVNEVSMLVGSELALLVKTAILVELGAVIASSWVRTPAGARYMHARVQVFP
jgi:hypothetical protein